MKYENFFLCVFQSRKSQTNETINVIQMTCECSAYTYMYEFILERIDVNEIDCWWDVKCEIKERNWMRRKKEKCKNWKRRNEIKAGWIEIVKFYKKIFLENLSSKDARCAHHCRKFCKVFFIFSHFIFIRIFIIFCIFNFFKF